MKKFWKPCLAAVGHQADAGRQGLEEGLVELGHESALVAARLVNVEQVHQGFDGRAL